MTGLAQFQQATLAMMGQSHKLNTIGQNVTNVATDGYKRTDTEFQTLLSRSFTNVNADPDNGASQTSQSDLGGVLPIDLQRIDQQGQVRLTNRELDVAIDGEGFFMVSPDLNVNTNIYYTRRGAFDLNVSDLTDTVTLDDGVTTATVNQGFLADTDGNYVLGVAAGTDGTFALSNPQPMRLDQFAFATTGVATLNASLDVNLPADSEDGRVETASISVVDSNFNSRAIRLDFTKVFGTENTWDFRALSDEITTAAVTEGAAFTPVVTTASQLVRFTKNSGGGDVIEIRTDNNPLDTANPQVGNASAGAFAGLKPGDSITIAGSDIGGTSNDGTYTIASVSDDQSTVTLSSATPINVGGVDGDTQTFSSSAIIPDRMTFSNKAALSSTDTYNFNLTFDDGATAAFALDVGTFTQFGGAFAVNNFLQDGAEASTLEALTINGSGEILGNFTDGTRRPLYKLALATFPNPNGLEARTGQIFAQSQFSGDPTTVFADQGFATIISKALEGSNVDLAVEMSRLIQAQQAYNLAATTFTTADEMLQTAGDLKR